MSNKTKLIASMQHVVLKLRGTKGTRKARYRMVAAFAKVMRERGYGIASARQIGGRHLVAYINARQEAGIPPQLIASELGHIRDVLMAVDKAGLAKHPDYSNEALGVVDEASVNTQQPSSLVS